MPHDGAMPSPAHKINGAAPAAPFNVTAMSLSQLREQRLDVFPIDEVLDERLQVVGTAVAVVDVVGVLPDIAAEDRHAAMHQRAFAVRRLHDFELAALHGEPAPARAELADARGDEIVLELGVAAEIGLDLRIELAGQLLAATIRLHPAPEVKMIVVL